MKKSISLTVITLLLAVSGLSAATHYVSVESTNPTPPYANWVTAATNIQNAVDVAATNDVVMVTNAVYPGGVTVTNPLTLLSVNGPQFTIINGGRPCASLTDSASLTGFTLTGGGGGVPCSSRNAFLTNCVITSNSVVGCGGGASGGTLYQCLLTGNRAVKGGGAYGSTLDNCALTSKPVLCFWSAGGSSGGACACTLYHCTTTGNSFDGAYSSTLFSCIICFNPALRGANYDSSKSKLSIPPQPAMSLRSQS